MATNISAQLMMTEWQQNLKNIKERDMYLLQKSMWTDCKFLVGNAKKEFACHRIYLAKTSPVFAAMLFGELTYNVEKIIIPDVTPAAFTALLQYIYEGELPKKLDFKLACELLYTSKKYMLPDLQMLIRDHLCTYYITLQQVWNVVEFATHNDEVDILGNAWHFVLDNASAVITSEAFLQIQHSTLLTLVQQQYMNIKSEYELYKASVQWALNQVNEANTIAMGIMTTNIITRNKGIKSISPSIRLILDDIIKHIRFLVMSVKEFSSGPLKDKILTSEECKFITKYHTTSKIDPFYNLSRGDTERIKYDHIYITGRSIDDIPTTLQEFKDYKFDNIVHVEYNTKQTQFGIQVPTQIETLISKSIQYNEQMSVIVYSHSQEKILESTTTTIMANYDTLINIAYSKEIDIEGYWEILQIYIIFHTSGFYPKNVCKEWCTKDVPIKLIGEFFDIKASFVWEPRFKFITHIIEKLDDMTEEEVIV